MRTVDEYADLAKNAQGFRSDRELGRALGYKGNTVSYWRQKKAWPSDDTMLQLAELAGIEPGEALIDLNIWRSSGRARSIYQRMAMTAAGLIIGLVVSTYGTATKAEQGFNLDGQNIHYARF